MTVGAQPTVVEVQETHDHTLTSHEVEAVVDALRYYIIWLRTANSPTLGRYLAAQLAVRANVCEHLTRMLIGGFETVIRDIPCEDSDPDSPF